MTDVLIKELKYIKGIPVELLDEAVKAGEIRKGKVVGLIVSPVENLAENVLIELELRKNGEEKAIKNGRVIPVDSRGDGYVLLEGWDAYPEIKSDKSASKQRKPRTNGGAKIAVPKPVPF